jgi:hypothetical protein
MNGVRILGRVLEKVYIESQLARKRRDAQIFPTFLQCGSLLLARLGPARRHLGIPLIEAMLTRYARCEFFSP